MMRTFFIFLLCLLPLVCFGQFGSGNYGIGGGTGGGVTQVDTGTTDTTSLSNRIDLNRTAIDSVADSLLSLEGDFSNLALDAHFQVDSIGGIPRAYNCWTHTVDTSGASIGEMIRYGLNHLTSGRTWKEKVTVIGVFTGVDSILIPSYTILNLEQASLTSTTDWNDRDVYNDVWEFALLQNADTASGNTDIDIIGGYLESSRAPDAEAYDSTGTCVLAFRNAERVTIRDAYIKGGDRDSSSTGCGILFHGCENCYVFDCIIDTCDYDGIQFHKSPNCIMRGCDVVGGSISSSIQIAVSSNIGVSDCILRPLYAGLKVAHEWTHGCTFSDIVIELNSGPGSRCIDLADSAHDCTFDNIICDSLTTGIYIRGNMENVIENTFQNCEIIGARYGVRFESGANAGDRNYFIDNTFANCYPAGSDSAYLFLLGTSADSNKFYRNRVINYGSASSPMVADYGSGNIFNEQGNEGWITENKGVKTVSGGNDTITIAHGLSETPTWVHITPMSADADTGEHYVTDLGVTNFLIVYDGNTASGSNNITWAWEAFSGITVSISDTDTVSISDTTYIEDTRIRSGAYANLHYGGRVTCDVGIVTTLTHSLIRVKDVADNLGAGATIIAAGCSIYVSTETNDNDSIAAYRVFKPWNEAPGTYEGDPSDNPVAGEGYATWDDWSNDDEEWGLDGCQNADDGGSDNSTDDGGADRKATAESITNMDAGAGWYSFTISAALAQSWYEGTAVENGVLLMNASATVDDELLTFSSSENATAAQHPRFWFIYVH